MIVFVFYWICKAIIWHLDSLLSNESDLSLLETKKLQQWNVSNIKVSFLAALIQGREKLF